MSENSIGDAKCTGLRSWLVATSFRRRSMRVSTWRDAQTLPPGLRSLHLLLCALLALAFLSSVAKKEINGEAGAALQRSSTKQEITQKESAPPAFAVSDPATDRRRDRYLMLVNTAAASKLSMPDLAQFDRSPYDGLAVAFLDAYETSPVPTPSAVDAQINRWKKATTKHIWPWVYLNRMIGANADERNQDAKVPYFQRIQGVDLDGKAGAQQDFLDNWRNALRTARDTKVPGIVCDLEFYNNYKASDVAELTRMTSRSPADTVRLLKQLGAQMAEIAAGEYPSATLWFLFTGFTRAESPAITGQPYHLAATYIVEGLLDEIQALRLPLHILSGGEVGLGYCHVSVEDLRQTIQKRARDFAPTLQKYSGILELAGTMTLWSDQRSKKSWVADGACGASSAATVEDLEPYMELLFRSYRYNWIYGSINGGYYAFEPGVAPRFDAAIAHAQVAALQSH